MRFLSVTVLVVGALVACGGGGGKGGAAGGTTTTPGSGDSNATGSAAPGSAKDAEQDALSGAIKVGIALDVTPKDASVTIDEVVYGKAGDLDAVVALAPGLHTLEVKKAGFKTYRAEFSVTDKTEKFTVVLEK